MSIIDLKMVVEVDMEQLDKLREKMKQTDELFLKKIEKATTILPKGVEKVDHAWLQMVSKVGVYVDKLVEYIKRGFDQICYKNCNPKGNSRYYESKLIIPIIVAMKKRIAAMKKRHPTMFLILCSFLSKEVKFLPQNLHTIASSLTSSAQYGHFFIAKLRLEGSLHV
jgi:hypothetical protein